MKIPQSHRLLPESVVGLVLVVVLLFQVVYQEIHFIVVPITGTSKITNKRLRQGFEKIIRQSWIREIGRQGNRQAIFKSILWHIFVSISSVLIDFVYSFP